MKCGILWHSVSTGIIRSTFMPSSMRSLMVRSRFRLPAFVADEVIVCDQEARSPDDVEQIVRQNWAEDIRRIRIGLSRRREAVEVKCHLQSSHELVGPLAEELGTVD